MVLLGPAEIAVTGSLAAGRGAAVRRSSAQPTGSGSPPSAAVTFWALEWRARLPLEACAGSELSGLVIVTPVTDTPEEFGERLKTEMAKSGKIVRDANIRAD